MHFSITLMKGGHRFLISVPSQSLMSQPPISSGVIRITESNQGQKGGCFRNLCRIMADSKKGKKWKEMKWIETTNVRLLKENFKKIRRGRRNNNHWYVATAQIRRHLPLGLCMLIANTALPCGTQAPIILFIRWRVAVKMIDASSLYQHFPIATKPNIKR